MAFDRRQAAMIADIRDDRDPMAGCRMLSELEIRFIAPFISPSTKLRNSLKNYRN